MKNHQNKLDVIIETHECNICWEVKHKFRKLKCNHEVCTTCFPQIRNNLCPFCRRPIDIIQNRNNRRNVRERNSSHFSNLSLDDNLLIEFAESFDDLHITRNNRINRRQRNRNRRRRNRNRRNRRNTENNQNETENSQNGENETENRQNGENETENETEIQNKKYRKKSRIKNRKSNRWNSLRNQCNFRSNYRNSY